MSLHPPSIGPPCRNSTTSVEAVLPPLRYSAVTSAGIAVTLAVASALSRRAVRRDLEHEQVPLYIALLAELRDKVRQRYDAPLVLICDWPETVAEGAEHTLDSAAPTTIEHPGLLGGSGDEGTGGPPARAFVSLLFQCYTRGLCTNWVDSQHGILFQSQEDRPYGIGPQARSPGHQTQRRELLAAFKSRFEHLKSLDLLGAMKLLVRSA